MSETEGDPHDPGEKLFPEEIVEHCCETWNKLVAQPWRITSIGLRDRAHRS